MNFSVLISTFFGALCAFVANFLLLFVMRRNQELAALHQTKYVIEKMDKFLNATSKSWDENKVENACLVEGDSQNEVYTCGQNKDFLEASRHGFHFFKFIVPKICQGPIYTPVKN